MHVRRTLALAVVAPLLLAGCTDDAEPTPKLPDPTASSSTPTPTESETPEAESAEDFIRRWQAASDNAQTSGDTSEYRKLGDGCEPCDGFASRVDQIYEAGGNIDFSGSRVLSVNSDGPSSNGYQVRLRSTEATIIESAGAQPSTLQGGELTLHVFLKKAGSSWVVGHYTILPTT